MSQWKGIKPEDIELSDDKKEIEIYIGSDDFGSNYVTILVEDIKKLLNNINK